MDAISETRLDELYPELAKRFRAAMQIVEAAGFTIRVTQGLRTWGEQNALYAQGRTAPGPIVTHAKGGESWHNLGCALDFAPMNDGQPIWDEKHPAYEAVISACESQGLTSGSRWPEPKTDFPHIQLTGRLPENAPDSYALYLFKENGLRAVWNEIDTDLGVTP